MRTLFVFLCVIGLSLSLQAQPWAEHRRLQRLEHWYGAGDFDKVIEKASKWRSGSGRDYPPQWAFALYKAKACYGKFLVSEGRNRGTYLSKAKSTLRGIRRMDRSGAWMEHDPEFMSAFRATLHEEAEMAMLSFNTQTAYQHFKSLAELYQDTTITYRLLEDEDYLDEYRIGDRADNHEIIPFLFLQYVNELRTSGCECGGEWMPPVGKVGWSDTLSRVSELHSMDMETNNYFDHTALDGSMPWDRAGRMGYRRGGMGENIAQGYRSEWAVFRGWKASPGHCKNMMRRGFNFIGLGRSGDYWTMMLSR